MDAKTRRNEFQIQKRPSAAILDDTNGELAFSVADCGERKPGQLKMSGAQSNASVLGRRLT